MSDAATAFMFRVHLGVLATNLTTQYGTRHEAADAHIWLVKAKKVDPYNEHGKVQRWVESPFRATDARGVYYSEEEPNAWMDPEEIGWVREVPRTRNPVPHYEPPANKRA